MEDTPQKDRFNRRFKHAPRGRFTYIWITGCLVILSLLLTDPDSGFIQGLKWGAGTVATLVILAKGVLWCTLLHFTRKGVLDYFNGEEAWNTARHEPLAAAVYMVGVSVYVLAMALVIFAANYR